ncbi:MAG: S9 family peptidase, partial [Niabella sp.]
MMRNFLICSLLFCVYQLPAQNVMTPELLWTLGRVSGINISNNQQYVFYSVSTPDVATNKSSSKIYRIPINGGIAVPIDAFHVPIKLPNKNISPDGKYILTNKMVKVEKVSGKDFYPELDKSDVMIYDNLMYRHWDEWTDGSFDHVFYSGVNSGDSARDIMYNQPYHCPTKPFGGDEDYIWSPDSKQIIYVTKQKTGKDYAVSTNTDIYAYDMASGVTKNLSDDMPGYDLAPAYSKNGLLAWLSMKRDGYEADKQDIVVLANGTINNLTAWRDDIHVSSFKWSNDGKVIYFIAPVNGTEQLFCLQFNQLNKKAPAITQITAGDFDITGIVGQAGNQLIVSRTDMNHAAELYKVDIADGKMHQLTHVNDKIYSTLSLSKTERRIVKTTDGKSMLAWVIYPPNFDPNKKYPTLLYCQGGPQSALTQFYSFRWNFQLMAANGYIVVAPNRRGMPGHGTQWNEQISKDWGGQVMKDYLSAIDDVAKENYVDKSRLGAVGASYGGYSVFYLAGIHNKRFKTFIAHDGVFDLRSMYGTTEEMWFVNWDMGGAYWDKKNTVAQNTYEKYSTSNYVQNWDTPILI